MKFLIIISIINLVRIIDFAAADKHSYGQRQEYMNYRMYERTLIDDYNVVPKNYTIIYKYFGSYFKPIAHIEFDVNVKSSGDIHQKYESRKRKYSQDTDSIQVYDAEIHIDNAFNVTATLTIYGLGMMGLPSMGRWLGDAQDTKSLTFVYVKNSYPSAKFTQFAQNAIGHRRNGDKLIYFESKNVTNASRFPSMSFEYSGGEYITYVGFSFNVTSRFIIQTSELSDRYFTMNKLLSFLLMLLGTIKCSYPADVKIAIIGGGIGGTSCAYFLREIFNESAEIHLYEGNKLGGRLATASMSDGNEYETGGSVLHKRNKYMSDFVTNLGLEKRPKLSQNERLGLFNGHDFDFIESEYYLMNIIKMLWRYGYSVVKLQSFIGKMLDQFDRIYNLQKEGHTFANVHELLAAMDPSFINYLNVSVKDGYVKEEGFSEAIVDELVQASLRCNYGQTINVHKFVGSVSMAGMDGELWAVNGGNRRVPEQLIKESKAKLINDYVMSVAYNDFKYLLSTRTANTTYDYVVIATPLSENQQIPLNFTNFPKPISRIGNYHRTVSTLVLGKLNKGKFPSFADGKASIIIDTNDKDFFNSIGNLQGINGTQNLDAWKVFSKKPLTANEIDQLFESHEEVKVIDWLAYPHYDVPIEAKTFVLAPRLYHINAIEWAASAMEMSCIGAKNVALLIKSDYGKIIENETTKRSQVEL